MERAAREREEMAAKAARLKALRTPAAAPAAKRSGRAFLGLKAPTSCESNSDCDRPQVCCDLVVARVCWRGVRGERVR